MQCSWWSKESVRSPGAEVSGDWSLCAYVLRPELRSSKRAPSD